jgi:hypothetical protein
MSFLGPEVRRVLVETLASYRRGWGPWILSCILVAGNVGVAVVVRASLALKERDPHAYDLLYSRALVKSPTAKYFVACGAFTLATLIAPFIGRLAKLTTQRLGRAFNRAERTGS